MRIRKRTAFPTILIPAILVASGCAQPGSAQTCTPSVPEAGTAGSANDGASQAALAIDSVTLLTDLSVLSADSMEGRAAGTPGSERARRYLDAAFARAGLETVGGASYRHEFALNDSGKTGVNFIGCLPGRNADRFIVVSAHYDHLGVRNGVVFNGTDDNASGVAAILAIAGAMRDRVPASTILFVAMDAEEGGLRGARAFVADPPVDRSGIAIDINLDMVSRNAAGELWAAGTRHYPFLLPVVESLAERAPVTLRIGHDVPGTGSNDWTNSSDHGPFHRAGIPFLYFGVEDHEDYHRPTDDFEKVDPGFYVRVVRTIGDAILSVDALMDASPARSREAGGTP